MTDSAQSALIVDHGSVWQALRQRFGAGTIDDDFAVDLVANLQEKVAEVAPDSRCIVLGDWSDPELGQHARMFARCGFEVVMDMAAIPAPEGGRFRATLQEHLARHPHAATLILATTDGSLSADLEALRQQQRIVLVWGIRTATPQTLCDSATNYAFLDDMLSDVLDLAQQVPSERPAPAPARPASRPGTGPFKGRPEGDEELGPMREPAGETRDRGEHVGTLDAIIVHADYYMRANRFDFLTFAKFLDFLHQRDLVGHTDAEREIWLKAAVETGSFQIESVTLVDQHTHEPKTIRRFRLVGQDPRVDEARRMLAEILAFLSGTLTDTFNPSFSKLRDHLQQQFPALTMDRIHGWLSWYKETRVILSKEVPHKKDPSIRVKLIRLNPDHFLVKHLAAGPYFGPEETLVCLLDAYLVEHDHEWMAASKLLERLADKLVQDGRAPVEARREAKEVLDGAKQAGLITVSKPVARAEGNPDEGEIAPSAPPPASQVYLCDDKEWVCDILDRRDDLIQAMHDALRGRVWIARSTLQRELLPLFAEDNRSDSEARPHERIHFWIGLMTYLRQFVPRQVPNPRGGTTHALVLNPSSKVVQAALEDLGYEDEVESDAEDEGDPVAGTSA